MGRWLAGLALLGVALCAWILGSGEERGGARAGFTAEIGSSDKREAAELAAPVTPELADAPPLASGTTREVAAPQAAPDAARARSSDRPAPDALVVEVVAPDGTPLAGIPLRVDPGRDVDPGPPPPQVTDARGRAVFDGLRPRLALEPGPWWLRAELAFEEAPRIALSGTELVPVVRFELPPGGPLDVVVRELDGQPAPRGSSLRLKLVLRHELHELDLAGPEWKQVPEDDGTVHFPWVELGRAWELAAWRPKGVEPTRLRTQGPVEVGERIARELVLGSDHPVVSYRVLTPERRPLVSAEVELGRSSNFGSRDTSTATTDAQGRFTVDGRTVFFQSGTFLVTHRPPAGPVWVGRARLPVGVADGRNDGGDILLAPEPLLCAGLVLDASGAPVHEADVVVGREHPWMGGHTARTRCDAAGRFELRGLWIDERFPVRASSGSASSEEVTALQGDETLVLVLQPRFTLTGELVLDPGVDPGAIHFALERRGQRAEVGRKARWSGQFPRLVLDHTPPPRPGHFELEPIEGGPLDLLFLLADAELTRVSGLDLRSDLDLGTIDLRARVHLCEIELVGADDPSTLSGEVDWGPSGTEERRRGNFHGPLVTLLAPRVPIDVELRPRGHRLARIERLSGRVQHTLEAPLRVRLVLMTFGTLPPSPYRFDAELYRGETAVSQPVGPRWFTPERLEIECLVATPGPLVARWHLEKKVEGEGFGGAMGTHVLHEHWVTLDVRDEPGLQVFPLALDARALERVTQELDG
ncbi:MAG TPA: carboxypeptidase-like regulatory domain-containing protein [Planctomycetota bacterium]